MEGKFLIYALHHPDSSRVYVGKSSSGLRRPHDHGRAANLKKHPHWPVVRWIKKLRGQGRKYEIAVLESCTADCDLNEAEQFHIAYLRSLGVSLLNCTDGGEGATGYKHTSEHVAKMKALYDDPARRDHIGSFHRGRKKSDETRARMSRAAKGKAKNPEAIAKGLATRSQSVRWRLSVEAKKGTHLSSNSIEKIKATKAVARQSKYSGVDWSLPNCDIARQLGKSSGAVSTMRKRLQACQPAISAITRANKEPSKREMVAAANRRRASEMDARFVNIDWSQSNSAIGRQTGVDHHTVAAVRKRLGVAPSLWIGRTSPAKEKA